MQQPKRGSSRITGALMAFENTIRKNEESGAANSNMYLSNHFKGTKGALKSKIAQNVVQVQEKKAKEEAERPKPTRPERTPWKSSNLALINSDLARKIREAAAELEPAWTGVDLDVGTHVWRIEQFLVVPWPKEQYGEFHTGDSYIVLHAYRRGMSATIYFDVHIWIGSESSQDEYGTAAYKMVECDDYLGGRAVQHRQVQGHESEVRSDRRCFLCSQSLPSFLASISLLFDTIDHCLPSFSHTILLDGALFYLHWCDGNKQKLQSYFNYELTYLEGGVDSGFNHVEEKSWQANLYKVKGTEKGLSMTQMELTKSSLNSGDSFILFVTPAVVFVWHGTQANPDERAKANVVSEKMCTQGTTVTLEEGAEDVDGEPFWNLLGTDGEIGPAEDGDENVQEFAPTLFRITDDYRVLHVAEAEKVRRGAASAVVQHKIDQSLLDDDDVFLLDAGWDVYLWIGNGSDKEEKVAGLAKADEYLQSTPRTANLPLTIIKSGWETPDFLEFFH